METNHKEFKPFDKILVREGKKWPWRATFYSHYNPITFHHYTISGAPINDILPYEGNEELVGRVDEPEEEVKLEEGEWIIASDNIYALRIGLGSIGEFRQTKDNMFIKSAFQRYGIEYEYAIRLKDFDPSNMEETRKHILEVKNGKVVKYKG